MKDQLFDLIKDGKSLRQVQLLLEAGCDVNCFNERHETPLMTSMINVHDAEKRQQMVRLLLLYNANVNCRNRRGQTPFMYACILNQKEILNILLNDPRLDVNNQDFEGNTAVMYACALGHIEVMNMIVAANDIGAININPAIANHEGVTARDYALDTVNDDMINCMTSFEDTWALRSNATRELHPQTSSKSPKMKHERNKKLQSKERITRLAETIDEHDELADTAVVVWKEDSSGKPNVIAATNTDHQPVEPAIVKKRSVLNIHLPRAQEETLNDPSSRPGSVAVEKELTEKATAVAAGIYKGKKKNKRLKTKAIKKARIQTNDVEVAAHLQSGKGQYPEFGNEIAFCNKIYGTDLYPCNVNTVDELLNNITTKVMNSYNSLTTKKDRALSATDTCRMQYPKLSNKDRARFLTRSIWSVYGEPLPPIPISASTMTRILAGISELKQYLSRAKYQPGRLLSLDPELWCIIESMKSVLCNRTSAESV